jgi:SAM-dependent methyltransferase
MNRGYGLVRGDAVRLPLADESVDLIITSPPYFALRSYQDDGEHYAGQIGSEPSPMAFLAALWAVTDECWRVLKPTGSLWVDLGDKYSGSGGHNNADIGGEGRGPSRYNQSADVPVKSLMGLPWRFALGLIAPDDYRTLQADDYGDHPVWTLRAEVIWSKCLSGGTTVYARVNGRVVTMRLHDLCRHYRPEAVQLWNGRRWTQVQAWEPTARDGDALELELRTGERIGCTPEHRWPVVGQGNVAAQDLHIGDVLEAGELPDGDDPDRVDDEVGWFVGAYLANGSRSQGTIQIAAHVKHEVRAKRLAALAASYGERCAVHQTSDQGVTVNLTGRFLDAILATYIGGTDAYTKHLRPATWGRSNRFLAGVLQGYIDGDCHTEPSGRVAFGFTGRNDQLAMDLRTLAARLGHSLRLRRGHATGFGRVWPTWAGTLYRDGDRRKGKDTEVVAIRRSRARRFWDIAVADDPHLFALASGVLTHNSNGLPESVTDRVRRSHETWFHLTKGPRYYATVDEVREKYAPGTAARYVSGYESNRRTDAGQQSTPSIPLGVDDLSTNPLGKLPGSVWTIPSEPLVVPDHLGVDHFAAFPQEWPRRIILGWSPPGICTACGEGRRPVVEKSYRKRDNGAPGRVAGYLDNNFGGSSPLMRDGTGYSEATITGYACACDVTLAPTRPAVVLDPFVGTGTVVMVARALGRYGVGVDLSRDYLRLARWRISESRHGAKSEARTNRERQGVLW